MAIGPRLPLAEGRFEGVAGGAVGRTGRAPTDRGPAPPLGGGTRDERVRSGDGARRISPSRVGARGQEPGQVVLGAGVLGIEPRAQGGGLAELLRGLFPA